MEFFELPHPSVENKVATGLLKGGAESYQIVIHYGKLKRKKTLGLFGLMSCVT